MNTSFAMRVPIFIIQKMSNNETKNNFNMDVYFNPIVDSRSTPGSVLPLTPYEIWQMERYGNFISESNPIPQEPSKTFFEYQIEIYEFNEVHHQ
jgi:hypothetical protein